MTSKKSKDTQSKDMASGGSISKDAIQEKSHDEELRPFDRQSKVKFLFMILTPLILIDFFTKDYLFDASMPVIRSIREKHATKNRDLFFEIVSQLGDRYGFTAACILSYTFFELDRSFTITLCNYSSIALLSFLKSVNHEARPFHISDIVPSKCSFEFGNPSGHSLWCTSVWLCFWDMACQQNKWKFGSLRHTLSFLFTIAMIAITSFSRIWHAVHTMNQLFSGYIWGFGLYYLFCYIFFFELRRFVNSIKSRSTWRLIFNFGTRNFFIFIFMGFSMYLIGSKMHPMPQEWRDNIEKNCQKQMGKPNVTIDPELYNFEKFLNIMGVLGTYIGIIIEQKYVGTHIYPNWNNQSFFKNLMVLLFATLPILTPITPMLFMSKSKYSYLFTLVFRNILPAIIGNIILHAFTKFAALKLGLINTDGKDVDNSPPYEKGHSVQKNKKKVDNKDE